MWNTIENNYVSGMKEVFKEYWNQWENIIEYFSKTQKQFIQYLGRPDTK